MCRFRARPKYHAAIREWRNADAERVDALTELAKTRVGRRVSTIQVVAAKDYALVTELRVDAALEKLEPAVRDELGR